MHKKPLTRYVVVNCGASLLPLRATEQIDPFLVNAAELCFHWMEENPDPYQGMSGMYFCLASSCVFALAHHACRGREENGVLGPAARGHGLLTVRSLNACPNAPLLACHSVFLAEMSLPMR